MVSSLFLLQISIIPIFTFEIGPGLMPEEFCKLSKIALSETSLFSPLPSSYPYESYSTSTSWRRILEYFPRRESITFFISSCSILILSSFPVTLSEKPYNFIDSSTVWFCSEGLVDSFSSSTVSSSFWIYFFCLIGIFSPKY